MGWVQLQMVYVLEVLAVWAQFSQNELSVNMQTNKTTQYLNDGKAIPTICVHNNHLVVLIVRTQKAAICWNTKFVLN